MEIIYVLGLGLLAVTIAVVIALFGNLAQSKITNDTLATMSLIKDLIPQINTELQNKEKEIELKERELSLLERQEELKNADVIAALELEYQKKSNELELEYKRKFEELSLQCDALVLNSKEFLEIKLDERQKLLDHKIQTNKDYIREFLRQEDYNGSTNSRYTIRTPLPPYEL